MCSEYLGYGWNGLGRREGGREGREDGDVKDESVCVLFVG